VNASSFLRLILLVLLEHSVVKADNVLPLVMLEKGESGTCVHNVGVGDRGLLRYFVDAQLRVGSVEEKIYDGFCPVGAVTEKSKITERFFWTAQFVFFLAELVGEFNQQFTVSMALVLW